MKKSTCPHCGRPVKDTDVFCPHCRTSLNTTAGQEAQKKQEPNDAEEMIKVIGGFFALVNGLLILGFILFLLLLFSSGIY